MKIKSGFILREIEGKYIVLALGERSNNFNKMIKLNESGAFLWGLLEKGAEENELANALEKRYTIPPEKALLDTNNFLRLLQNEEII